MSTGLLSRIWGKSVRFLDRIATSLVLILLLVLLLLLYLYPSILIFIHPGETGVLWKRFTSGTVTGYDDPFVGEIEGTPDGEPIEPAEGKLYPYSEGVAIIFPWDVMYIYSIRLQEKLMTFDVLSQDGLRIEVGVSVRWKLLESDIGKLHKFVGPDYVETLLVPTVTSYVRARLAESSPGGIYSSDRLELQERILKDVKDDLRHRFFPTERRETMILVEDVLIRSIVLPPLVQEAIEMKRQERHRAEAHYYRLFREQIEAERKAVEASGIERFQATITNGIDDKYLLWRGIDATLELAKSDNAKIVIIGSPEGGLPLIIGGLDGPETP